MAEHFTTLRYHPDLAREIGLLIGDYAALDLLMCQIYIMLCTSPPPQAFSEYFGLRSINRRCQLVMALEWRLHPDFRVCLKRLWKRLKTAASRRTDLSHVHFMHGEQPARLFLYGDRVELRPLTDEIIRRTTDQYHTLQIDLLYFAAILRGMDPDRWAAISAQLTGPLNMRLPPRSADQAPPQPPSADELAESRKRLGIAHLHGEGGLRIPRLIATYR